MPLLPRSRLRGLPGWLGGTQSGFEKALGGYLVAALSILLLTCKPATATSAMPTPRSTNPVSQAQVSQAQPATAVRQADGNPPPQIALRMLPYGFDRPLFLTHAGDGSGRLFIVEKGGMIRIVKDG